MATQYVCEQCGQVFEKHWGGTSVRRFCSVVCRNRHVAQRRLGSAKKFKVCPTCGHYGKRKQELCTRCGYLPERKPRKWTAQQIEYLREHYATQGAEGVATALGLPHSQVRNKAMRLRLNLSATATRRIVHDRASTYMSRHNPMRNPESLAKRQAWLAEHPQEAATLHAKLLAGHQRLQRDKPSKLEERLRAILSDLLIDFEPSAMIKDKFIVDIRIGTLIIQADGDYWHGHPRFAPLTERQLAQQKRDRAQDAYLTTCGYTIVRIWESEMSREKVTAILREHHLITAT